MVLEEGGTGGTGVREQFVRAVGSSVALEEGGTGGTGVCEQFVRAAGSLLVFDVHQKKIRKICVQLLSENRGVCATFVQLVQHPAERGT